MPQPFKIRPAQANDINFVLHSWLKRYRDAISARLVTDRVYYEKQHAVIRAILGKPGLKISVACDLTDENLIYGYCVGEQLTEDWVIVHWTYVKGPFRKFLVGTALLKDVIGSATNIHYSHRTHLVEFLDKNKQAKWNPFYVWSLL